MSRSVSTASDVLDNLRMSLSAYLSAKRRQVKLLKIVSEVNLTPVNEEANRNRQIKGVWPAKRYRLELRGQFPFHYLLRL